MFVVYSTYVKCKVLAFSDAFTVTNVTLPAQQYNISIFNLNKMKDFILCNVTWLSIIKNGFNHPYNYISLSRWQYAKNSELVNHVNKLMSNGLPFLHMYIRSLSKHSTSLKILRSHAQNHQKLQPGRKQIWQDFNQTISRLDVWSLLWFWLLNFQNFTKHRQFCN